MKKLIFLLFPLALQGQIDKHERNYNFKVDTLHNIEFVPDSVYPFIYHEVPYQKIGLPKLDTVFEIQKHNHDSIFDYQVNRALISDPDKKSYNLNRTKLFPGINRTKTGIGLGLMFLSGVANGYHETILNHYPQFKRVHPNANDSYCNPDLSWLRKYKNGDPAQGEAFWQSTGFFAPVTDLYHLTGVVDHGALFGGSVVLVIGEKRKWYEYAIQLISGLAARSAGFYLVYDVIYK